MSLVQQMQAAANAKTDNKNISTVNKAKLKAVEQAPTALVVDDSTTSALRSQIMQEFDGLAIVLEADLAQLKTLSDIGDKKQYKAEAIEKNEYFGYALRYIESGANHPNSVLAWLMIWLVDLNRWSDALAILPTLIAQEQKLPKFFSTKNWHVFFIDYLYDAGNQELAKHEADPKLAKLRQIGATFSQYIAAYKDYVVDKLSTENEVVAGKLFAMAGKLESPLHNYGNALDHFVLATSINDGAGVKKIGRLVAKKIGVDSPL